MKIANFLFIDNFKKEIIYTFLASFVLCLLDFEVLSILSFLFGSFLLYVSRDKEIKTFHPQENAFYSPVDAEVFSIQDIDGKYFKRKIVLKSSIFDKAILKAPINSLVKSYELIRGARLKENSKLFNKLNERLTIVLEYNDKKIKIVHRTTNCQLPILSYLNKKENIEISKNYGFLFKGICEIYLPDGIELNVGLDQKLKQLNDIVFYIINEKQ